MLQVATQYWTSRGFAVVDVNYGGSTGYGRPYRNLLRGEWGIVDVDDCEAAARWLGEQGRVDPSKLCIRGGSAGGYTTLAALAFRETFAAGASHYGVADLEALATDTHKFEARYLDSMVGPYPESRDLYVERSPIHHLDAFDRPLIVLQGLEDEVVPPNQSEMIVDALRAKGVPGGLPHLRGRAARLPPGPQHPPGPRRRALLLRPGPRLRPPARRGHRAGRGREPGVARRPLARPATDHIVGSARRRRSPRTRSRAASDITRPQPPIQVRHAQDVAQCTGPAGREPLLPAAAASRSNANRRSSARSVPSYSQRKSPAR